MKNRGIVPLAVTISLMIAPIMPSFAEEDYYIEIGGDINKTDAEKEWQALMEKHKAQLNGLHFFPKTVIQAGSAVGTRIQAGPINNKNKAQKICNKLFSEQIPCFVIEGLSEKPPRTVMNMYEKAETQGTKVVSLPWSEKTTDMASSESTAQEAIATPKPVILPWLAAKEDAAAAETVRPTKVEGTSSNQAKVEVAEAIRVPLTSSKAEQQNAQVTIKQLPEFKPVTKSDTRGKFASENNANGGWLLVEAFPDADFASSFWQDVRQTEPEKTKGLRVRVEKPLLSGNKTKVSLSIGPFASNQEAYSFCHEGLQADERGLTCRFEGNDTVAQRTNAGQVVSKNSERYQHSDGYTARRERLAAHRGGTSAMNTPYQTTTPSASSKLYWVQVLSASSQMQALNEWETMKTANSDLLNGMRSSVSASLHNKSNYVVRVGPLANNNDAASLCTKLQGRGVECRVLLYSNQ